MVAVNQLDSTENVKSAKYVLISPCRDEAAYIKITIDSIAAQTVLPTKWVIVDDGSTDSTPEILAEAARKYPFIQVVTLPNRRDRLVGAGVIETFYQGLKVVPLENYDYLCKLDMDLQIPHNYFESMISRMEENKRIGTCSGKPYFKDKNGNLISEKCGDETSVGMIKFYRRECFQEIGGFVQQVMWDGIDCHQCRRRGWIACSWDEPELRFIHLRPMGSSHKGILKGRMRHGYGQYFMGTGPLYMIVSALYRMTRPPYIIGGFAMLIGYFKSWINGEQRYDDEEFRSFLQKYQWNCLIKGKSRATQELNAQQARLKEPLPLTLAYFINQYPKVSHSFIRREIAGIEAEGIPVKRFSIRSLSSELVDPQDKLEDGKTRYILKDGSVRLATSLLYVALTRPVRFFQALQFAVKLGTYCEKGALYHLAYLAEACVLLRWFAEGDVTHVHVHFMSNAATVMLLCQILGGPTFSCTVHIPPENNEEARAIALREKIDHASFVVAISEFCQGQLQRWCPPEQWDKIRIVHCGVDREFFSLPPVPIPDGQRLVCVARLEEKKGILLLLDAVVRLKEEGRSFKLVLVGDGTLRDEIESRISKFGLQDYVHLTGWASSSEVREQILASRALVLPSYIEGLPVAIMESLALRRPVISTTIAAIPELVKTGVSGWLIPPGSLDALTEALRQVLDSSTDELEKMGMNGFEEVAKNYNAATEAAKLAVLFQDSDLRRGNT